MFNKKGESQMDKIVLVVEIIKLSDRKLYNIKKSANSLDKASEYLVALNNLNDDSNITYELFNKFAQFEVDRIEKVANDNK
jgi:hypothetical protein